MKWRPLVVPGCVVLVCLWTSCGRSSVSSAVASSYDSDPVHAIPGEEEGLTVRPDVLRVSFAFGQESESLEQAVPKLKAAVERYVRAATEASKVEVAVKMKEVGLGSGKRMAGNEVMAHGVLEVALPEAQDFWSRTVLVATLVKVGSQEAAAAEKANTGLRASFGFPVAQVREPEARRDELVKRWVERARGFVSQAQSERAPLQLVGCEPPGAVKQAPVSVDEVVLSLAMSCRLDAVTK
ncbi:hypothetical protein [Archangium violaceum]|uniref:Lipoprotein n=1 Tax=Archangium violaceum Cb vi76 TaxID=1406225 RepID=A0A084SG28_9BACT|nr:hypothetical protein [Archangium violaceum]KFA87413.1 hypothetical protein Q664_47890 [Archangium violaceum Cb vi76]